MSRMPDVELVLREYLAGDGDAAPDYVLDVVAERIGRQDQRRTWRLRGRPFVNYAKLAAAVAAVLVIGFVGWRLLPADPSIGGQPTPAPTATAQAATPAPTATPAAFACDDPAYPCAGPLTPGEHESTLFRPLLTFTVPNGWVNSMDRDRAYTLHNNFAPAHFFQIYSQVAIPEQNAGCTAARKAGVGSTVADWTEFLTSHPGLVATTPVDVTVGGHDGVRIDVHVGPDWTATCPNSIGPAVFLITDSGTVPDRVKWIDDQYTSFRILDVAGETVILYIESGPSDPELEGVNRALQATIDTFELTP